jgi:hypothetical protein
MADKPSNPPRVSSPATTTARPSLSPLRQRPLARSSTLGDMASHGPPSAGAGLSRRRSSFMTTDSFDRASLRSSTDSLFLPRVSRDTPHEEEELPDGSSHLHSIPLALALLPAIGGLFFQNGSAVFTDVTLLVLAAIFLNWSIRLPWDWYHSAQAVRVQEEAENVAVEDSYFPPPSDTIEEEGPEDGAEPSPTAAPAPPMSPKDKPANAERIRQHEAALRELRLHELLALIACFGCPLLGAWLLHHIRGSLSRPSEGLVSDYNLSIFVLASEIRPLSHLLRMIQSRTLHLQRIAALNPYSTASPAANRAAVQDLQTRVDELEMHIASHAPNGKKPETPGLTAEKERELSKTIESTLRAALQPELDAVTRATRRYEKRATLLGLQTESRLNVLESRVQDAVALAAGAERAQQARNRGGLSRLFDAAMLGLAAAGDLVSWVVGLPMRVLESLWDAVVGGVEATVGRVTGVRFRKGKGRGKAQGKDRAAKSHWVGKEQSVDGSEWSFGGRKGERKARTRKE